jgi:hypothetical protein
MAYGGRKEQLNLPNGSRFVLFFSSFSPRQCFSFFLSFFFFNLEHTYKIIVKRAILSVDDF